jgi:hypothetical protein
MANLERWTGTIYVPEPASSRSDPGRAYEKADRYATGWKAIRVFPPAQPDAGAVEALRYLAFGLEMLADGTVRPLPGAITHEGLREARAAAGGQ